LNINKLSDARLRLTVTAGEGDIVPNPSTCKGITVFIAAQKMTPLLEESYRKGFKAIVSSLRRNSQSPLSRLKTGCYLENVLAKQEARTAGADEAILLNETGLIAEGSSSNLFCVDNNALLTPPIACGALPGITREVVMELAQSLGIKAIEAELTPEALLQAEEAFFTNSIAEIMPLTYIGDRPVGDGKPGATTIRIMEAYRSLVADYQHKKTD
jgi:branched-chain amino acid aminotransferase